jgi:hypothetical protein
MRRQPFTPRKFPPGTHFYYILSRPQGIVRLQGLRQLTNAMTSSGIESMTFAAFSIVPQLTALLRVLIESKNKKGNAIPLTGRRGS